MDEEAEAVKDSDISKVRVELHLSGEKIIMLMILTFFSINSEDLDII